MFVSAHLFHRVVLRDGRQQCRQTFVLFAGELIAIDAFEFNADREIVAIAATQVLGFTGVPGPRVTADKLNQIAGTPNIKMG